MRYELSKFGYKKSRRIPPLEKKSQTRFVLRLRRTEESLNARLSNDVKFDSNI